MLRCYISLLYFIVIFHCYVSSLFLSLFLCHHLIISGTTTMVLPDIVFCSCIYIIGIVCIFLLYIIVMYYRYVLLLCIIVIYCCYILSLYFIVTYYRYTSPLYIIVMYSCYILLLCFIVIYSRYISTLFYKTPIYLVSSSHFLQFHLFFYFHFRFIFHFSYRNFICNPFLQFLFIDTFHVFSALDSSPYQCPPSYFKG